MLFRTSEKFNFTKYLKDYSVCSFDTSLYDILRLQPTKGFSCDISKIVKIFHLKCSKAAWEYKRDHLDHHTSDEKSQKHSRPRRIGLRDNHLMTFGM